MNSQFSCLCNRGLEQPRDLVRSPLLDVLDHRTAVERFRIDRSSVTEIVRENRLHLLSKTGVEDHEGDLIVQRQRSVIEIHGSDARPGTVSDERLCMQGRRLVLVDAHASGE